MQAPELQLPSRPSPHRGAVTEPRSAALPWARIQAWSGLLFAVFATLHLLNTALAALGPAAYNGMQRAMRPVQHLPLVEGGLILLPLVVHAVAGVARMRKRRGKRAPASRRARLHRYAGYFLLAVMAGHVFATRGPDWFYGIYPEFEGLAFTFQVLPQFFFVYYPILALAGLCHLVIGVPLALGVVGWPVPMRLRRGPALWLPLALAGALLVLGVAGLGGLLGDVPDQSSHPFARKVVALTQPLLGNP